MLAISLAELRFRLLALVFVFALVFVLCTKEQLLRRVVDGDADEMLSARTDDGALRSGGGGGGSFVGDDDEANDDDDDDNDEDDFLVASSSS